MTEENKIDNNNDPQQGQEKKPLIPPAIKEWIMKNKALSIAAVGVLLLFIVVKISTGGPKEQGPQVVLQIPDIQQEENVLDSALLEKARRDKDPLGQYKPEEKSEELPKIKVETYPVPSFVTSNEDTLIWKDGVYKRIGTLQKLYGPKDTIEVEGQKYIREEIVNTIENNLIQKAEEKETTQESEPADTTGAAASL